MAKLQSPGVPPGGPTVHACENQYKHNRLSSDFGFRISDFGFQPQVASFLFIASLAQAAVQTNDLIPPLRPLRGELGPTFWERYSGWIALALVLAVVVVAMGFKYFRRSKPVVVLPPEARARQALEALRGRPEDTALVTEVSHHLRQYVVAAFGLPPEELTTTELHAALGPRLAACPELLSEIIRFLRQCDERKFAPASVNAPLGAVDRALELVRQSEAQRQSPAPAVTAPGAPAEESHPVQA